MLWFSVLLTCVLAEDICDRCECLPDLVRPSQALCRSHGRDQVLSVETTQDSKSLELVILYGIPAVNFEENSIITDIPVTVLILNCSDVFVADRAFTRLRFLVVKKSTTTQLGYLPGYDLWAVLLEDLEQLTVDVASLVANHYVHIANINSVKFYKSTDDITCSENFASSFTIENCKIEPVVHGGLFICGGHTLIRWNTFKSVAEEGIQILAEESVAIINNTFDHLQKQALNLTSPEIHISGNHFRTLPAGSLRGVSTLQDTFFTNNIVEDIDLGGVLLDMGWDMIVENNRIECDCASKRTSILNPKEDMLFLTNSSLGKLHSIFYNNFCNMDCIFSLEMFSYALSQGTVCVTNITGLEQRLLCNITVETETSTQTTSTAGNNSIEAVIVSSATKVEVLVPLSIILVIILITSSVCYGCKEMNTFKFKFSPSRPETSKIA